jgi:hypothetical protein
MQESAKPLLSNSYQYESIEQGDSSNLPSEVSKTSRSKVFYGMMILMGTMAVVLLSGGRNIRNISPMVELPVTKVKNIYHFFILVYIIFIYKLYYFY